jgi:TolA-binding protein
MWCFHRSARDDGGKSQFRGRLGLIFVYTVSVWLFSNLIATKSTFGQNAEADAAAIRQYNLAVGLQNKKLFAQAGQRWGAFIEAYPQHAKQAHAWHNLGICQLQENKLAEAVNTFRDVLTKFPKFESLDATRFNLGLALYNQALASKKADDFKIALTMFVEVPTNYPQSKHAAAATFYQAECLYSAGDLPKAVEAYQKCIATYPQDPLLPQVYHALGTTQQELAKETDAAATFQAVLQKFPQDPQVSEWRLRLALSQFNLKKYSEAEQLLTQLVNVKDFTLADFALLKQAQCLHLREQFPQAAAVYESLPSKFASSKYKGQALIGAGKCWFNAQQFPQAQSVLKTIITQKLDEAPEAAFWSAQCLLKMSKPAEALAMLEQALSAYPQSEFLPQLMFARADAVYELPARRKEAAPLYLAFAAKYPDHDLAAKAAYMACLTALQVEDLTAAQQNSAAFLANPKFAKHILTPDVLFVSGESLLLGPTPNPGKAETDFQRLVTDFPQHSLVPQAQVRIGLAKSLAKQNDAAIAWLNQIAGGLKDPALKAESQLLIGRSQSDAGRAELAIAAFRLALAAKPDWVRNDEVLLGLGITLRGQKKLSEAATEISKLVAQYPKSPYLDQSFMQLGEIAYEQSKYDESIGHYRALVTQIPKSELAAAAQYGIGWSCTAKEDFNQAVASFTTLLNDYPKHAIASRGRFRRGLAYRRLSQFEPAIKDLTEFVASKPAETDALEARYAIGLCQIALKQPANAATTFAALLKDKPDYSEADKVYYELGFALAANDSKQSRKESAEAFRALATRFPDSPRASESWFRVGEFQESERQFDDAAAAYSAGLKNAKSNDLRERLQYKLGWVQYENGKYAAAAAVLRDQIKEFPKGELFAVSTFLTGECLFRQEKWAEALPCYLRIVELKNKELDKALYRSATCANNLKDWIASQQSFTMLIEKFPQYEMINEARYGLGLALQMQQKLDDAKAVYEQVTKATNSETAAKSRFMIGECAFAQKKFSEAVEHFLETAVGYPYEEWQAQGYYEAARCFIALKQIPQARETLAMLMEKYAKHARAKDAKSLLESLK